MRRGALLLICAALASSGADWPEWRGKDRLGVWNETGIVDAIPASGLAVRWRRPVQAGFSGPAVAAGRVYVSDFAATSRLAGTERLLAFDEKTGAPLWKRDWPVNYRGLMETYAIGPRATPTVDGDRVYMLGAAGALRCVNARTGVPIWERDYVRDFGAELPTWGVAGAPLVDGPRLLCVIGGKPGALVVALDKMTGREVWRALDAAGGPGYSQPFLVRHGTTRQLIVWHPLAVSSLDPATGKVYWEQPFRITLATPVATPVQSGARLLVSSFYNGSLLLELDPQTPRATVKWKGKSNSEIDSDGLHALVNTPVIAGDYIYGICSYGQMRCIDARTGERVWETLDVTREKARWASGFIVRNGGRYFINNDRGELMLALLSPAGYKELGRTQLIKPTSRPGNRRELGAVNWSHPAYANRHIFARNDEEVVCASLERR